MKTQKTYVSAGELARHHGYYRDTMVALLTALLVEHTHIKTYRVGNKTLYKRSDIDALMMETAHV